MRWANEERWEPDILAAAYKFGVPANLIRAIIGAESGYTPSAMRREVAIKDASIGLMQILVGTARGEGYTGDAGDQTSLTGLFNPSTNIYYGTSFLGNMYRRTAGDIPSTISAYNGGYRPSLGFGSRATAPINLCLARDATGKCISTRAVKVGEFGNQPYVDKVMAYFTYFENKPPVRSAPILSTPSAPTERYSPPLDASHRAITDEFESSDGGDNSGTPNWWTRFVAALVAFFKGR